MSELGRLQWLCRRGMKELDLLLTSYLEHNYSTAAEADKEAFRAILQMPDPELNDLILARFESDDEDVGRVITILREFLTRS